MIYRSKSQFVVGGVTVLIGGGLGIGGIFGARSVYFSVFWVILGLVSVCFGVRLARACVKSDENGICIENLFRSVDVHWGEISCFELGRWKLLPAVCLVNFKNGEQVPAVGLQENTNFPNGAVQRMIDSLNEQLRSKSEPATANDLLEPGQAQRRLFSEPDATNGRHETSNSE